MIPALGFLWDRDRQLKFIDILSSFASDLSIASCSWFQIDDIYMNEAEDDEEAGWKRYVILSGTISAISRNESIMKLVYFREIFSCIMSLFVKFRVIVYCFDITLAWFRLYERHGSLIIGGRFYVNIASLIITSFFLVDSLNGSDSKPSAANIFAMVCLIFDVLITGTEEKLNQGNDNNSRTSDSDDTIQRGIIKMKCNECGCGNPSVLCV